MTDKNSKDIIFKELGSLQERVLFFLAENQDNHKQAIQQGIQHPSDQYGSVSNAVDALEKLDFLEAKEGLSQKKVKIKIYRCTESGVFYALTRNPSGNVVKILESHQSRIDFCKSLRPLYEVWGHEHFQMYLNDVAAFLPLIQKEGLEAAKPYLLMRIMKEMKNIDPETRRKNVKEALRLFPEMRQNLKELQKNIEDVLN